MLYINYFEYAAVIITAIIVGMFLTRRSVIQRSSTYFLLLCITTAVTSITDIISSYTISYPESFPLPFNFFISATYIFSFVSIPVIFMLYTDSLAKIGSINRIVHISVRIYVVYEAVMLYTSQFTRLGVYFDENLVYQHGPLFYVNYVFALLAMGASLAMVVRGRVRFSKFQQFSLIFFTCVLFVGVFIQVIFPELLLGGFICTIMMIFLYVAFENPAYFFYQDTRCQNRFSFYRTVKSRTKSGKLQGIVVGRINYYESFSKLLSGTQRQNLSRRIADTLAAGFKLDAYLLSNDTFAVLVQGGSEDLSRERQIEEKLHSLLVGEYNLSDRVQDIDITTSIIPRDYTYVSADELESIIGMLLTDENNMDESAFARVEEAVAKKRRRDSLKRVVEKHIKEESFRVYYQPIYSVKTGRFESAEALVRLIDDKLGFISPEEFIPLSEEAGLILPLGEIVFRKVCSFLKSIDKDALGLQYVEVNLSPVQCENRNLPETLFSIMDTYDTDPASINFEITETADTKFSSGSTVVNNILEINSKGVSFSIDDFGSGFAAMDHLFQLPFDLVKVDKSILWQAMEDENAMIVLKNTFRMVHELEREILVEGVETQEMVDILKSFGCNYMQGYFFSKPIPEEEFIEFLKERNR